MENIIVKKAGPNYIIEIPKLIEQQVEIKDKTTEVRSGYLHELCPAHSSTKLILPSWWIYTVEGIEALNKEEVQNSTGGFISKPG